MEGVGSRLATIEVRRRYPFGIAVGAFSGGPALLEKPVVRSAGHRELIDVGAVRPGPIFDMVELHVEQKNWAVVRTVVGYYRYDTASELLLLNEIWHLQSKLTNYFHPQQKLISKVRTGAKVSRKHDKARTPFHRAINHPSMAVERIVALKRTHSLINPAATQRQIQALTAQLFTLATSKAPAGTPAPITKRARSREATNHPSRAS